MPLPNGFAYIEHPNIKVDLFYCRKNNWLGGPLPGYKDNVGIAHQELCRKLYKVADNLSEEGLGLIVYDAYRPMPACTALYHACTDPANRQKADSNYHPNLTREKLYAKFITDETCYATGTTVAVGLVDLKSGRCLDMGGGFAEYNLKVDFRGNLPEDVQKNRAKLRESMKREEIFNLYTVWWQFSLSGDWDKEPYHSFDIRRDRTSCWDACLSFFCGRNRYHAVAKDMPESEIGVEIDNILAARTSAHSSSDTDRVSEDSEDGLEYAEKCDEDEHYGLDTNMEGKGGYWV